MKILNRFNFAFLSGLLMSLGANAATFEQGITFYAKGEYEPAHRIFLELAEFGNCDAMFNIGVMYLRGQYVDKNKIQSWAWMKLSDTCSPGKVDKTLSNVEKHLSKAQLDEAINHYKKLEEYYGSQAVYERSVPDTDGLNPRVTPAKVKFVRAPEYPLSQAQRGAVGTVQAMFAVSEDGLVRYITVLSANNKPFTESMINMLYTAQYSPAKFDDRPVMSVGEGYRLNFSMDGAKFSLKKYNEFIDQERLKALEGGSDQKLAFAFLLGELQSYTKHLGNDPSTFESPVKWFHKAAVSGSPLAKFTLGVKNLRGQQCKADVDKALYWLLSAASDGVLDAKFALGYEFLSGHRVPRDTKRGLALLEEAAQKGYGHAALYLAWLLSTADDASMRNVKKAQQIFDLVNEKETYSYREYYETLAALSLSLKDYKEAKRSLKKLKKFNKKAGVDSERESGLWQALEEKRPYVYKI